MGESEDRISRSTRLYQVLLRFFPADFREAYGRLMLQVFRDQLREASSPTEQVTFWMRTLLDLFTNAWEEHMQKQWGKVRSFVQPSPTEKPLRWLFLFCVLTLVAFYLYRLMVLTISTDLVALLLERTALEVGSPLVRILRHGYVHIMVFSLLLAAFQSLLFRNSDLPAWRWFLASSIGWTLGMLAANQIWSWVGPALSTLIWRISPSLLAQANVIAQVLVLGLIVGAAQLWALWKRVRLYALWPLLTLAGAAAQFGVFEILLRRPEATLVLFFTPYLASALLTGLGLVLLLPREAPPEPEAGPAQGAAPTSVG